MTPLLRLEPQVIRGGGADLLYFESFFSGPDASDLYRALVARVAWEQQEIRVYGRLVACPRLSAWYGDPEARYAYSGLTLEPREWIEPLLAVKDRVESVAGLTFNSVLANLYRDGADSMGLHADDEPELGARPVIASVSFGAVRRFRLRRRTTGSSGESRVSPIVLDLAHGSLLIMRGETQQHWRHEVPKTRRPVGGRVNLTFRTIAG